MTAFHFYVYVERLSGYDLRGNGEVPALIVFLDALLERCNSLTPKAMISTA